MKRKLVLAFVLGISIIIIFSTIILVANYGPNGPQLALGIILNKIFKNNSEFVVMDEDGIPIVNYGFVGIEHIGSQRNPVTISQKLFEFYSDFKKTGNETSKQYILNNANWLVSNSKNHGNYSILYYNFSWVPYDMPNPWRSGMAQGQGLQALVKAHEITNNSTFLDTAELLLNSFFVEVKNGGVTYKSSNNGWWYEEYSHEKGKESRVLNGMNFAILGIHEYYTYTNETNAKFLFDKGVTALKQDLPKYDFDGHSYYDSLGKAADKKYHKIHVNQSKTLYEITNDPIFKKYYHKWKLGSSIP